MKTIYILLIAALIGCKHDPCEDSILQCEQNAPCVNGECFCPVPWIGRECETHAYGHITQYVDGQKTFDVSFGGTDPDSVGTWEVAFIALDTALIRGEYDMIPETGDIIFDGDNAIITVKRGNQKRRYQCQGR